MCFPIVLETLEHYRESGRKARISARVDYPGDEEGSSIVVSTENT